tara:strand:- start:8956 stop:9108 length:153 start_codon:yes stop_codon:yes gene_type:complete
MEQTINQEQATPAKPGQTQPVETGPKWYKKWWIWVIVVIILGVAGYFIFM